MTVKKAIEILESFLAYKEYAVKVWGEDKFQTGVDDIRLGNENLARHDKDILKKILEELTEKKGSKRKKNHHNIKKN